MLTKLCANKKGLEFMCVCVCVRACVRACVHACVCVCGLFSFGDCWLCLCPLHLNLVPDSSSGLTSGEKVAIGVVVAFIFLAVVIAVPLALRYRRLKKKNVVITEQNKKIEKDLVVMNQLIESSSVRSGTFLSLSLCISLSPSPLSHTHGTHTHTHTTHTVSERM